MDSVAADCKMGGVIVGGENDDSVTAVLTVSESDGAILAGGGVGIVTTCEEATTDSLGCKSVLEVGTADADADGSTNTGGEDVASDMRTALPVPTAEVTAACDVGTSTTAD